MILHATMKRIEGSTVDIEYRWAEGHVERLSALAHTFVPVTVGVVVPTRHPRRSRPSERRRSSR